MLILTLLIINGVIAGKGNKGGKDKTNNGNGNTDGSGSGGGDDGPCPDCLIAPYYTCYEQNKYTYAGFRDPEYTDNPLYPQYFQGDVCDHTDPTTNEIRNICRFQVHTNDCSNPEAQYQSYKGEDCTKTWSWGCSHDSLCPEGWEDSDDGCVHVRQMIVCCCRGDFCNGEQYLKYSIQGFTDPNMACDVINGKCAGSGGSGGGSGRGNGGNGGRGGRAMSDILSYIYNDDETNHVQENHDVVDVNSILVIFMFFMVGSVCCVIGLYIGNKLNGRNNAHSKNESV